MKCSYCSRQLTAKTPQVLLIINDDSSQAYCGSPKPGSAEGLSCWQEAIQAWNHLIKYQQAAPSTSLESSHSVLRVKQSGVSLVNPTPPAMAHDASNGTAISRRRHRMHA